MQRGANHTRTYLVKILRKILVPLDQHFALVVGE